MQLGSSLHGEIAGSQLHLQAALRDIYRMHAGPGFYSSRNFSYFYFRPNQSCSGLLYIRHLQQEWWGGTIPEAV